MRLASLLALLLLITGLTNRVLGQTTPVRPRTQAEALAQQAREQEAREDALHDQFFQSQGAHFTVLFEGPQDYQLAGRVLEILEQAYFRIGATLQTFPDRNVTVVLYTREQFRDITRAPEWAAAAYDGKIRVPLRDALEQPQELERVLVHELAHAMLHAMAPRGLPMWLNEGLASAFEPRGADWADELLARTPRRLPWKQLTRSFRTLSGDDARLAYAQSARAAKRLLDDSAGTTLVSVLRDMATGATFEAALEQRYFLSFDAFVATLEPTP